MSKYLLHIRYAKSRSHQGVTSLYLIKMGVSFFGGGVKAEKCRIVLPCTVAVFRNPADSGAAGPLLLLPE